MKLQLTGKMGGVDGTQIQLVDADTGKSVSGIQKLELVISAADMVPHLRLEVVCGPGFTFDTDVLLECEPEIKEIHDT